MVKNPVSGFGYRALALLLSLGLVVAGAPVFAAEKFGEAAQGAADGREDARSSGLWFFSGLLLPGLGIILPLVFPPHAPTDNLIGKSAEYVEAYAAAYTKKAKTGNVLWSLGGSATTVVAAVVLVAIAASAAQSAANGCADSCGNSLGNSVGSSCSAGLGQAALARILSP